MNHTAAELVASHDGSVRLVYAPEQLQSSEPHAIVRGIFCLSESLGGMCEEQDVIVDMRAYARLTAKVAA